MSISTDEVKKLAELSRLALSEGEVEKLRGEIDSILKYVDAIQKVELPEKPEPSVYLELENVTREDKNPHAASEFSDVLLKAMPRTEGKYLKVKKILP